MEMRKDTLLRWEACPECENDVLDEWRDLEDEVMECPCGVTVTDQDLRGLVTVELFGVARSLVARLQRAAEGRGMTVSRLCEVIIARHMDDD